MRLPSIATATLVLILSSACATPSEPAAEPAALPDAGADAPPPALAIRSGATRRILAGYGTSVKKYVSITTVLSTSPDLCGPVPATAADVTISLDLLLADDALRAQPLAHRATAIEPGAFRGWVHPVGSDCHVQRGGRVFQAAILEEGSSVEIVKVDGEALTLRVDVTSALGSFHGTVETRACTSRFMHLDVFTQDDELPNCTRQ